ncbi:MAG: patatin-like phospholipase family protein [Pseudomonadales bacterium]|jgi:NTE family protein|nr:patatin-like phospholipase family protein [Pseudomonadales bacterium]|tara:strand:- start:9299 stop:10168 length:870 start_codon:yes stop_codon:yes gene_type:complete
MPTVALVLGSGGARGNAHIGVIQILEEQGFDIISVSGCSMGAVVGGMYAAGKLPAFTEWVSGLSRFDVFRLVDMSLLSMGAIRGEKAYAILEDFVGDQLIEDLPIPYTAVATDLVKQQEVWFQSGHIMDAIRASVAVPGMIMPVTEKGRFLVDGGLLNPVPIMPVVPDQADLIISVNLNTNVKNVRPGQKLLLNSAKYGDDSILSGVNASKSQRSHLQWNKMEMLNQCFETMQATMAKYKMAGYEPDIEINIDRNACNFFELYRAKEMIEIGRHAALEVLQGNKKLIKT